MSEKYIIDSVVDAMKVLDALAESGRPMTATDVAAATGLNRNKAFRVLYTLQSERVVSESADYYRLDMRAALWWARYKSRREAEKSAIDRDLSEIDIQEAGDGR